MLEGADCRTHGGEFGCFVADWSAPDRLISGDGQKANKKGDGMPRVAPDRGIGDEELWYGWTEICTDKIHELSDGEYLILQVNDDDNVFVQMARMAPSELICEVSLGRHTDHETAMNSLLDMGWHAPGSYIPGPNLQCVWQATDPDEGDGWIDRADAEDAAGLVASTLRYVLAIPDPQRIPVERGRF